MEIFDLNQFASINNYEDDFQEEIYVQKVETTKNNCHLG